MLTAILGVTTVICAVGWFFSRVSFKTILFCWKESGYPPPTDEEIRVNTRKVLEKIFSFGAKTKR